MNARIIAILLFIAAVACLPLVFERPKDELQPQMADRNEVVFWHFWGGPDREVVEDVARRFNETQSRYFVRPVAMPGNNLHAKLFLSIAGGDPPDLVNQDDPVLAEWARRGIIQPMDAITTQAEATAVREFLFDSAEKLSTYNDRLYGVCNGLDIRALFYNQTVLGQHGLEPPRTIDDLTHIAHRLAAPREQIHESYGYLPDSRRLWAWGYAWGGDFLEQERVTVDTAPIRNALRWMQSFARDYGPDNLAAFRQGDQSLPGKTFPLLPIDAESMQGRYSIMMDGQWRVRDIVEFQKTRQSNGLDSPVFGVCPLPSPPQGRRRAGWVNGNFFVVPTGARNSAGAWEFIKFWIGFINPEDAAHTCADGGWIPVSQQVVNTPQFRNYLESNPLFGEFVELASSPNQYPIPQVPGAAMFRRTVEGAAYEAMTHPDREASEILGRIETEIQNHLDRASGK